jgi:hypothetical protein
MSVRRSKIDAAVRRSHVMELPLVLTLLILLAWLVASDSASRSGE